MTNIAFLISEIISDRTARILQGASEAARECGARIAVYPGRYLVSPGNKKTVHPDYYQETAVFQYIDRKNTDVIVIDFQEIGKQASARKKEAFLSRFASYPLLMMQETEGYGSVTVSPDGDEEQLGRNAVYDALKLAGSGAEKKTDTQEPSVKKEEPAPEGTPLTTLSLAAHALLQQGVLPEENPYDAILTQAIRFRISAGAMFLFPEAVTHTEQEPFILPETILCLSAVRKGKLVKTKEAKEIKSGDVVTYTEKLSPDACIFIVNNLFLGNRQLGVLVTELTPQLMSPHINSLFLHIVAGTIRLIANDQQILRAQDRLREHQEALDKDASVLERLGNEDYLTKRLNRRGFFSQAYDLLQKSFRAGTIAIVAYIDIDSIKSINEFFGREEGDYTVRRVADILSGVFGKESVLGRIRGNEFAVVLITEDEGKADVLKEEMGAQNMRLMSDQTKPYMIHLQFSICSFRFEDGLSLKQMLAETDDNLQKVRQM